MTLARRSILTAFPALLRAQVRPNILLLVGDNWAAPHASALGDPVVKTPNFDRLANEGVLFTSACAPNPSCSPSRSSILTGQETHRLKDAANLYGTLQLDYPTYTSLLEKAGYLVGASGKGWAPGESPVNAQGRRRNPAGDPYPDFGKFLSSRVPKQPFCFWFGSQNPHVPWNSGTARLSRMDIAKVRVPRHLPDHEIVRKDILSYYAEVEEFDAECGRILDTLRQSGEMDNTLIVMTSDNGWQLPRGLANCYTHGVRVPMAMRFPERVAKGQVRNDFASVIDLAPTFLDAAGLPIPKAATGQSLFGKARRSESFLERERHANVRKGNLSYPIRGVMNGRHLYLRNFEPDRWPAGDPQHYWAVGPYGDVDDCPSKRLLMKTKEAPYFDLCFGKRPAEELYDLKNDPDQTKNLAADPSHAIVKRTLSASVADHMKRTGDPRSSGPTSFWDELPYTGPKFQATPDL